MRFGAHEFSHGKLELSSITKLRNCFMLKTPNICMEGLRQVARQDNEDSSRIWFSICPMCETIFMPKVNVCSKCGFSESDWVETVPDQISFAIPQ